MAKAPFMSVLPGNELLTPSRLSALHLPKTRAPAVTPQRLCTTCAAKAATRSERLGIAREQSSADAEEASTSSTPITLKEEARQDRTRICDKLIAVFSSKPSSDWRKLIAFSKQWPTLCDSLFARIDERVKGELDQKKKSELRKLGRKLRTVHEELSQHNSLLSAFQDAPDGEWERLVASKRSGLTTGFFSHMENLVRADYEDVPKREDLIRIATRLVAMVEAFDKVAANAEAMQAAAVEFDGLLSQVNSLEEADKRIDDLAKSGKLDPALLLTMAKAYSAAKDTDYTKEEVKDVMAHLYFKAKESFAAQQPTAIRILKHLLWVESPSERREAMEQAFTPGAELATSTEDYLTTTPEELSMVINAVLQAYDSSQGKQSMLAEANALMNPVVIERMREMQQVLRKHFL